MKASKYSTIVEGVLKEHNFNPEVLKSEFSEIIKKTVISYQKKGTTGLISYYDSSNGLIIEFSGDLRNYPQIGTVEIKNRRAEYQKKYDHSTTRFSLKFTDHDEDVISHLRKQENMQGYIKKLIREDMKQNGVTQDGSN